MESIEKYFDIAFSAPDGIKKLREMILTLAMQGKLVPQNPKDKSATELLKEIQTQKDKLIKSGKIKKQQVLSPITENEIPYKIPDGWGWVRLAEIVDYNGRDKILAKNLPSDTWVLDLEDIEKETSRLINRVSFQNRKSLSTKSKFDIGDVLYGKLRPYLDKVLVAEESGICTTEIVPIRPYKGINPYFVRYLLKRPHFIAYVNKLSYGVKMPRLGTEDALNSIHPLPPESEQFRIVDKINSLMSFCDELEKLRNKREEKRLSVHNGAINALMNANGEKDFNAAWQFITKNFPELYSVKENVTELRKAILQLAIMGKLVSQDPRDKPASELLKLIQADKDSLVKDRKIKIEKPLSAVSASQLPFRIPHSWSWSRLGDVCFKITDGFHNTPKRLDDGFPYVFATHVKSGKIDWGAVDKVGKKDHDELYYKAFPQKGEILVVNIGAGSGDAAIIDISAPFSFKNIAILKFNQKLIYNEYLLYFLFSVKEKNYREITNGGCQPFLSLGILKNMLFPVPPINEQMRIVTRVKSLMSFCDALECKIVEAEKVKTALLTAIAV